MKYNKAPISLREGRVAVDGLVIADCVKLTINFTPDVWTGRQLGERTRSSRWLGFSIAANMTRRRSTPFLKDVIKKYKETGETPELTIQGIMEDKASDYYKEFGKDEVTCVGCVLTGDLPLTALDSEGQIVDDQIALNVYDVL